jgi:hypothetical protein
MGRHSTDYDPVKVLGYGPGDVVIYTGKNGHDHDKVHADKYLFTGNKYRVAWVDVGSWHSDVWLEGFDDKIYFNSVHFENHEESTNG